MINCYLIASLSLAYYTRTVEASYSINRKLKGAPTSLGGRGSRPTSSPARPFKMKSKIEHSSGKPLQTILALSRKRCIDLQNKH